MNTTIGAPLIENTNPPKNSGELVNMYKDLGFEVEVEHNRYSNHDFNEMQKVVNLIEKAGGRVTKAVELDITQNYGFGTVSKNFAPRGGVTRIELRKNGILGMGFSYCSIGDNFSRFEGVKRAMERAAEDYQLATNHPAKRLGVGTEVIKESSGGMASDF